MLWSFWLGSAGQTVYLHDESGAESVEYFSDQVAQRMQKAGDFIESSRCSL
jgi:hypothetical protein